MRLKEFWKSIRNDVMAGTIGALIACALLFCASSVIRYINTARTDQNNQSSTESIEPSDKPTDTVHPLITTDYLYNHEIDDPDDRKWIDPDLRDHLKPTMDDIIDAMVDKLGEGSRSDIATVLRTSSSSGLRLGGLTVSYYPPFNDAFVIEGIGTNLGGTEIAFTIGMTYDLYGMLYVVGIYQWEQVKG